MNFVCVNFGDTYHNAYVDALYYMLFMNNKITKFICITDRKRNIRKEIEQIIINDSDYEGAWNKLYCFHDIELPSEFILLDLDIVIQSKFKFNELKEIIINDMLLFIQPNWAEDDRLYQSTNINSSLLYINRRLKSYNKIKKSINNGDWYPYATMDRYLYNILSKKEIGYFNSLKTYSYLDNGFNEKVGYDICLLNKFDGLFFNYINNDHWVFKYYPILLSYPSTYHIDL
jgi:hypothetical protein